MQLVKILYLLCILGIITYMHIFFSNILYESLELQYRKFDKKLQVEALRYCAKDARFAEVFRKKERLPEYLKYILLWTERDYYPFPDFGEGQKVFVQFDCPVIDCYVTSDRSFFGSDFNRFHAIAFNGRNLAPWDLPRKRYRHQKFVYVNMESARYYPVCNPVFDNYFNWTVTYNLKSDILLSYFKILDLQNNPVGPKRRMKLKTNMKNGLNIDDEVSLRWKTKNKAVAWVASNCHAANEREKLAKHIAEELQLYNLSLDTIGKCGNIQCSKEIEGICWNYIEKHYYFYLAFENSNSKDYVTEKLRNAVQHFTIPIVFGGARYSRFLPRRSYLDLTKLSVKELVEKIFKIISSEELYKSYFRWRSFYKYKKVGRDYICNLCAALHSNKLIAEEKSYSDFRKWWYEDYVDLCKEKERNSRLRTFFTSPTSYFMRT